MLSNLYLLVWILLIQSTWGLLWKSTTPVHLLENIFSWVWCYFYLCNKFPLTPKAAWWLWWMIRWNQEGFARQTQSVRVHTETQSWKLRWDHVYPVFLIWVCCSVQLTYNYSCITATNTVGVIYFNNESQNSRGLNDTYSSVSTA